MHARKRFITLLNDFVSNNFKYKNIKTSIIIGKSNDFFVTIKNNGEFLHKKL